MRSIVLAAVCSAHLPNSILWPSICLLRWADYTLEIQKIQENKYKYKIQTSCDKDVEKEDRASNPCRDVRKHRAKLGKVQETSTAPQFLEDYIFLHCLDFHNPSQLTAPGPRTDQLIHIPAYHIPYTRL